MQGTRVVALLLLLYQMTVRWLQEVAAMYCCNSCWVCEGVTQYNTWRSYSEIVVGELSIGGISE
jgi:hypothetical protein